MADAWVYGDAIKQVFHNNCASLFINTIYLKKSQVANSNAGLEKDKNGCLPHRQAASPLEEEVKWPLSLFFPLSLFSQEDVQELISRVLPKQNQNPNFYELVTLPYLPGAYMGVSPKGQPEYDGNRNFRRNLAQNEFELYNKQRSAPRSKDVLDEYVKQCFKVIEFVLGIKSNKNALAEQITTIQSNMLVIEIVRLFARKFIADRNVDIYNSHRDKNIITNKVAMLLLRNNHLNLRQKLLRALGSYVIKYLSHDEIYGSDVNKLKEKCNKKLIEELSEKSLQVDNFDDFLSKISGNTQRAVTVFLDDNCEAVFYLDIILDLLKEYNQLRFILIPRARNYLNDVSYNDIATILGWKYFSAFRRYMQEKRIGIIKNAPNMCGVNLNDISNEAVCALASSDFIWSIGETNFEMLNGLKKTFIIVLWCIAARPKQ